MTIKQCFEKAGSRFPFEIECEFSGGLWIVIGKQDESRDVWQLRHKSRANVGGPLDMVGWIPSWKTGFAIPACPITDLRATSSVVIPSTVVHTRSMPVRGRFRTGPLQYKGHYSGVCLINKVNIINYLTDML